MGRRCPRAAFEKGAGSRAQPRSGGFRSSSRRRALVRALLSLALCLVASPALARPDSAALAQRALDLRLGGPEAGEPLIPHVLVGAAPESELSDRFIEWLPGEALEEVARTLAERRLELRLSPERAEVIVRLPLG